MEKKTIEYIKKIEEKYDRIDTYSKLFHSAKKNNDNIYEVEGFDSKKIEILPPKINFIQYAEPQVLISDYYYIHLAWYRLRSLIEPLVEEAFLTYYKGMYLSSISCIATCCEYVIKFEFFKTIREIKNSDYFNQNFTLGTFITKQEKEIQGFIENITIPEFESKIFKINQVRNGYFHFNSKKLFQINDNSLPISQEFDMIKITKEIYDILNEILEYFYTKTEKENALECLKDYKSKKKGVLEKLFKDKGPNPFGEDFYIGRFNQYKEKYQLDITYD